MSDTRPDESVLRVFARLADTLVADYDMVDMLQTLVDSCGELLDVSAAGILLESPSGSLELVASTREDAELVDILEFAAQAGPIERCYRSGSPVVVPDLSVGPADWQEFRDLALRLGFESAYALPLRLRSSVIGSLGLLRETPGELDPSDLTAAQALADVATIGILHERALRESNVVVEQLQTALSSRIRIEQAKGVVSHTRGVSVDEAFDVMRSYARSNRIGIGTVADQIVARTLRIDPDTPVA